MEARDRFGKAVIVVDRASSHRSNEVRRRLKENKGRIRLIEFPTASPRLSAIETWWAIMRSRFEDMHEFKTIKEKIDAMIEYLRTAPVRRHLCVILKRKEDGGITFDPRYKTPQTK